MIYFLSDYSQGAHPAVMEALMRTNMEHSDGYGTDRHCEHAASMIKEMIGIQDVQVHMMVGGTPCNITTIAAALRPYESVIALRTGHIYSHETGAIEATGHRVIAMDGVNGKLTPKLIDKALEEHQDEHTALPGMVYISQPTECGSVYSKAELTAISDKCREKSLYLYVDGARLGAALTCDRNDLSLSELAKLCDVFYIGGTKNGALFGEALVIRRPEIDHCFRYMIKRQGGLLARGRLIGVQFEALLEGGENSLYFKTAAHANKMAKIIREELGALGIAFYSNSPTNQVFPVLPTSVVTELKKDFAFHEWAPEKDGMIPIRLVTAWGTEEKDVECLVQAVKKLYRNMK
ncbi:MAG: threonine aldolase [Oscillospiraceae bacterium]|nr:threonine aldolase [Oscillospiraceae bacterium]